MANNKNQHFVPRCYLRPFTLDAQGLAISLFNLERKKLISNAPVKNQCSRDYFYGNDDRLEDLIQLIESDYSRALRDVIENSREFSEDNKIIFRKFWIFQHMRTEAAALRTVKMADSVIDTVGLPSEKFSIGIKDAVQISCGAFKKSINIMDDLKFCIVKNKTDFPFITSDNPAILTNKWQLDNKRNKSLGFGVGSAGMLAILPLTPKLLLLGYDGDVYNVQHENGIVDIRSTRDAIAFNRHQLLQCVANVYLHEVTHEDELIKYYSEIEPSRPKNRQVIHYAQFGQAIGSDNRYVVIPPENIDKTKRVLIHSQVIHPNPKIWPSQIKIRSNGSVYTNDTAMGYVRRSRVAETHGSAFRKERP